jgi:hypothetical protein
MILIKTEKQRSPEQDQEHHILHQVHHMDSQPNHNQQVADNLEAILASVYLILRPSDQPVALLKNTLNFDLKTYNKPNQFFQELHNFENVHT